MSLSSWPGDTNQGHNIPAHDPDFFSKHILLSNAFFSLLFILLLFVCHYILSYMFYHIHKTSPSTAYVQCKYRFISVCHILNDTVTVSLCAPLSLSYYYHGSSIRRKKLSSFCSRFLFSNHPTESQRYHCSSIKWVKLNECIKVLRCEPPGFSYIEILPKPITDRRQGSSISLIERKTEDNAVK